MLPRVLLLLLLTATAARAQTTAADGSELRIYLMTLGPGDLVWERFGHNALVVEDARLRYSVAYNYGMFSFDQPGFVPRLMKGRMLYWMEGFDTQAFADAYMRMNRSIWLQELNLSGPQKLALRDFLQWNAREENKFYRYDYYRDNCSTRIRDAIDRVLNGQLKKALSALPTDETYRSHTKRLTFDDPATYTGIMLAEGRLVDQPLSGWEESFIPMELREWVRRVQVVNANGRTVPLVANEVTVFSAQREPPPEAAPRPLFAFLITGSLTALALLLLARYRARRGARIALLIAVVVWSVAVGFFGSLITMLWLFTDHAATYYNENILQANPLSLALALFAPALLLNKTRGRRRAVWTALMVAGLSALGFVIQVAPGLDQVNGEIIALLMPVHGAIAYILWRAGQGLISSPRNTVTA